MNPLSIAHFTPFPFDDRNEINRFVERVADDLAARGHSVLIAAPGGGKAGIHETRDAIAALSGDPDHLYAPGEAPRVLAMGGVTMPRGSRKRPAPVSVDVGNRVEDLLTGGRFDIVHVHDPFLPAFSSTALRHSF